MFPFTIEAMTYNSTTAPEPADTDKSFKNTVGKDDGDDTQTATMSGKLSRLHAAELQQGVCVQGV